MKVVVSMLACFAPLLFFPLTGLAAEDCPSEFLWSTLKALYCANISRDQVRGAGARLGISEEELGGTFAESMVECGSKLALQDRDILEIPEEQGLFVSPSKP